MGLKLVYAPLVPPAYSTRPSWRVAKLPFAAPPLGMGGTVCHVFVDGE